MAATVGLSLFAASAAPAAEIKVFVTGAATRAYNTLAPAFERASGHKLVNTFGLPPALVAKVRAGEPFDVIILSYDVAGLVKDGTLTGDSRTVFGRTGIGVAIRKGSPKPEFGTVEAFKKALLDARTIATSGEGSSGRYVASLLTRLGIADQVTPKIRSGGPGHSAKLLSQGEVDFVVSGITPLIGTPDIEWLGYLPAELQNWIVFTGGVSAKASQPEAGRALLRFLTTAEARAVFQENGLDPVP